MQYSVAFKNISENDQLVLRLIFSLSAKARGRSHAYCLFDSDSHVTPDICIAQAPLEQGRDSPDMPQTIWIGGDELASGSYAYTIRKPLIASRVLKLLDAYVSAQQSAPSQSQPAPAAEEPVQVVEVTTGADELDFCITEEEASQLAIVDDETLSNPANLVPSDSHSPEQESGNGDATSSLSSLLVRHNNKDMEVSTLAFENRQLEGGTESRPRALVVDDSPSVRKQIELELDLFNVDVDFAESATDAHAKLDAQHYDVAFLDVVLPDGDGFRICRSIKSGGSATKVIMLTGKATAADKIKGSMAGCDAYLVKPVGRMTFQNTVCHYLQLREHLELVRA